MQTITNASLGFKLNLSVPSTVEEFDNLAKKEGACLTSATMNVVYRSWNNQFRAKFAEFIESATSIKRITEVVLGKDGQPKKDADGEVVEKYNETEAVYIDRVMAQLVHDGKAATVEAALSSYAADAQRIADGIAFDPSETEKAPAGPKKPSKKYLAVAEEIEKRGRLAEMAEKLATYLGHAVDADLNSVALAIGEKVRVDAEKAANEFLA